jgi:hypothetical protein
MKYRHLLSLSPLVLVFCVPLLVPGQAQNSAIPATIYSCDLLRDCSACMVNGTDCVFAAGECLQECRDDGASCYSALSHPELGMNEICELYDADNAKCTSQTSCQSCVATVKSDLGQCKWYPAAFDNEGACFGGGTGPFGSGEMTCDAVDATDSPATIAPVETTQAPTTLAPAPTDPPTTDAPATEPPTTSSVTAPPSTTDPESVCQSASSSCDSCLESNCAWLANVEACVPDCSTMADADCYSAATESPVKNQICLLAETVTADRELCYAQGNCQACLETNISSGSFCQWYTDADNELSWCEIDGCNVDGICGESTCDVVTDGTKEPGANATNATTTDGPCWNYQECAPCLSNIEGCAWSVNTCLPSCDMIADVQCVDARSWLNMTVPEICASISQGEEDDILCGRKNYCFTCTSTIQSDGVTKCAWYNDDAGNEWCGTGGCDANGICGETDDSICQFPTDPPATSAPAEDLAPVPSVTSAVSRSFSVIWSVVVAVVFVLGGCDVV